MKRSAQRFCLNVRRIAQRPVRARYARLAAGVGLPALLLGAGFPRGDDAGSHPPTADQVRFDQQIKPLLDRYCISCHGASNPRAGLNLAAFAQVTAIQRDQTTWRKALSRVRDGSMPPPGTPHPAADQRDQLAMWLTGTLNNADDSLLPKNPGHALIHRLTRLEYNNTVRDLFGVDWKPADTFPADGGGGAGFDNSSDTLFLPPILMERYLEAAGEVLDKAKSDRIFVARPGKGLTKQAAARKIVETLATRAFRRPVETVQVNRILGLYTEAEQRGEPFERAIKFALKAILVSPSFLYRAEADHPGEPRPVSDYELASRLSYFLWASMPDDTLLQLAASKRLRDPAVLDQQVTRMLQDPKAYSLADSFAGQWLHVRDLYTTVQPDPGRFPGYTPALRDAMYREPIEFFNSVVKENESLIALLDAKYTYVNEDLARHYGIPGIRGREMRRVALTDGRRGGVLTMASVLTLTSYPQRTSPVLRGKWVLEEIFGTPAPPPPPSVATLSPDDQPRDGLTFRQRLEQHRSKPQCASCHSRMDPLGFGLENYDGIGQWRTEIAGKPVDASGELTSGEKFSGPQELKRTMLQRKEEFVRNLSEKMLAFALGRGLEPYDLPAVRKIAAALAKDDYRSDTLIREIVKSYPFQYRQSGS